MKYSFRNDYSEIAHPEILKHLLAHSNEQSIGYGNDEHTKNAKENIKKAFELTNSDIHFVAGGTVANMTVISYALRPYDAVIACETGHINVHETGAIEASGHKVIPAKCFNGKISIEAIDDVIKHHTDEHMVHPKMVYISDSTETGSIYMKEEIEAIYSYCKAHDLYLFIDGARLSSALTADKNNVKPSDFKNLCDVFYIGGTKIGLMYGEALVINNDNLKPQFRYHIKNRGAMLAKGFVVGLQFEKAFENNLYFEMGYHENKMATKLANGLVSLGYILDSPQETNQIFVRVSKQQMNHIALEYAFEVWDKQNDYTVIRLVTSWFTNDDAIEDFLSYLK